MEVHKTLGSGFLEAVYQETLELEFEDREIPWSRQVVLDIVYKNRILCKKYFADFVFFDKIIVELKACEALVPEHVSQVIHYLKATGYSLGLLINFGVPSLQYKRIIL